jgi:hypothetical protein
MRERSSKRVQPNLNHSDIVVGVDRVVQAGAKHPVAAAKGRGHITPVK